jgi:hypothetical protein
MIVAPPLHEALHPTKTIKLNHENSKHKYFVPMPHHQKLQIHPNPESTFQMPFLIVMTLQSQILALSHASVTSNSMTRDTSNNCPLNQHRHLQDLNNSQIYVSCHIIP